MFFLFLEDLLEMPLGNVNCWSAALFEPTCLRHPVYSSSCSCSSFSTVAIMLILRSSFTFGPHPEEGRVRGVVGDV